MVISSRLSISPGHDSVQIWLMRQHYTSAGAAHPEMEFLDISLTKDSSLLLHALHRSFSLKILKETILFFGFKNPYKKSAKHENSSKLMNSIL